MKNANARKRKYRLPAGHAEVLVERDSLNYLASLAQMVVGAVRPLQARLEDQVNIYHRDAGDPSLEGQYDLVTAFECVHDMSDPVAALRTILGLAGDSGTVIIMDERVGDSFTAKGNDVVFNSFSRLSTKLK